MIPLFKVFMASEAKDAVGEVLESGFVGQGGKVDEFENLLRRRFRTDRILTLNSGTAALHLAMHMVGNDGDEVLTSPMTCTATNWPIISNRMKIKWVDIDPTTLNIDLIDLERKISEKTKIILFVHWGGYPVNLTKLKEILDRAEVTFGFRPIVIEDCAHAFGTTWDGKPLGNHGNFNAFSFQAIKHFTTVDGGMLITPDEKYYNRGKLLRWYGIDRESNRKDFRCEADVAEVGFKFHMNDVNATIGIANLSYVDYVLSRHRHNAIEYNKELKNIYGLTQLNHYYASNSSYWLYTLLVEGRDDFMRAMADRGIMVSRVHERNDKHSAVAEYRTLLPNLESVIDKMICIPVGWWVTDENRQQIVDVIKKGW